MFGNAFSAAALFLLGLRMVGQMHQLRGANLVTPCILICVKWYVFANYLNRTSRLLDSALSSNSLALPIVSREMVVLFHAGVDANDTLDLSNYGFLYGTFPTAPGVFVYASHFGVDVDLVLSTLLIEIILF